MRKFPRGGLLGKAADILLDVKEKQIPLHAAYAGYFIVLSVFPALLVFLSILRYTGIQVESLLELLQDFLPQALMDVAEEMVYSSYSGSNVMGLAALVALWSSSRGVFGVLQGLNAVYDVWEDRGYFYTRGISMVYTFLLGLVMLLTLGLHVFGSAALRWLSMVDNAAVMFLVDLINLRFWLLLLLQSCVFTLMFMVLPNERNGFLESLPGGILSSIGWMVFSDVFSVYVENFDRYSNIYGSMYAVALSLLWLYCCLSILFYGGALNHYLKKENP